MKRPILFIMFVALMVVELNLISNGAPMIFIGIFLVCIVVTALRIRDLEIMGRIKVSRVRQSPDTISNPTDSRMEISKAYAILENLERRGVDAGFVEARQRFCQLMKSHRAAWPRDTRGVMQSYMVLYKRFENDFDDEFRTG